MRFLEGYFESTAKNAGHSEKIANLMSEIRIQLNLVADPGRAGVVQHEAMANQIRQPADPIPAVRSREHHKVSKRGRVGTDDDNEVDDVRHQQAESIVPPPPSVMQSGGSASQASLGNDSSRKREETLISVTLRSV